MILTEATPVFYFVSLLYRNDIWDQEKLLALFNSRFKNPSLYENSFFPMKEYYSKEMGEESSLSRVFIVSNELSAREDFISHKLWACSEEKKNCIEGNRSINIDIGLMALEHILLATGKPYYHRPYLGQGVYADVTLFFEKKSYRTLSWTYPDYAAEETIKFLNTERSKLLSLIQN